MLSSFLTDHARPFNAEEPMKVMMIADKSFIHNLS
jgi:hypothetical protein